MLFFSTKKKQKESEEEKKEKVGKRKWSWRERGIALLEI